MAKRPEIKVWSGRLAMQMCLTKQAHDEKTAALIAARLRTRKREPLPNAGFYLCEICGTYHVTSDKWIDAQKPGGWGYTPEIPKGLKGVPMSTSTLGTKLQIPPQAARVTPYRNGTNWPPAGTEGSERVTVTPEMAAAWLERLYENQRPVNKASVVDLTAQIRNGAWIYDGASIVFDNTGKMIDGQHRCRAVTEACMNIDTMVVWGVDPASYKVKDTGRCRKASDLLGKYQNYRVLAGVARCAVVHAKTGEPIRDAGNVAKVTNAKVLEAVESDPGLVRSVNFICGMPGVKGLTTPVAASFAHYLMSKAHYTKANEFWETMVAGVNLSEGDPRLVLARFYRNSPDVLGAAGRRAAIGCAIKAWNAWRTGKTMGLIRMRYDEDFPVPV